MTQEIELQIASNDEDITLQTAEVVRVSGSTDYEDLSNKPSINGVELNGNKSAASLGLATPADIPTKTSELTNDSGFLTEHQSLDGYATEQWVSQQGYLTQHQDISGKLNISQGVGNAGKFMVVGNDGNIEAVAMAAWSGGDY